MTTPDPLAALREAERKALANLLNGTGIRPESAGHTLTLRYRDAVAARAREEERVKREPPPDHDAFLALRQSGNKAIRKALDKRRKPDGGTPHG